MLDKWERLRELNERLKEHCKSQLWFFEDSSGEHCKSQLWFFEDSSGGVDGYYGTEPVMFVGKNPSGGGGGKGNPPKVLGRFYGRLKEYGFARAHVTDIVKEIMPVVVPLSDEQLERNWPFFCEELSIVEPAVVVALGGWVFNTLKQRLGVQYPLRKFTHYAYHYKSPSVLEQIFRKDFEGLLTWQRERISGQP